MSAGWSEADAAAQIDAELCRLLDPDATVTVANASQKAPETPVGAA